MGNFNGNYMSSNGIKIVKFAAEINSSGAIALGIGVVFFILLIIAGFLIFNILKNHSILDEDTNLGKHKGIAKISNN